MAHILNRPHIDTTTKMAHIDNRQQLHKDVDHAHEVYVKAQQEFDATDDPAVRARLLEVMVKAAETMITTCPSCRT